MFPITYHVGQIVFIGKMFIGDKWTLLSIPKGNSKEYNAEKFAQPKTQVGDEFLKNASQKKRDKERCARKLRRGIRYANKFLLRIWHNERKERRHANRRR